MPFIPHTADDTAAMLSTIGVSSIEDLFDEIPPELRCGPLDDLPDALSEMEVGKIMRQHAAADDGYLSFLGAGAYEHHIPAAVWELTTRGEFYTAYTPYQAEASQGTLQLLYEFQTMMAGLTGMEASNASLYDGATAVAEAILMAVRVNRKSKSGRVLVSGTLNPRYTRVAGTTVEGQKIQLENLVFNDETGQVDLEQLEALNGEDIAALVIQQPNYFGVLEQVDELVDWAKSQGIVVIAVVNPISLSLLKSPGDWGQDGADIVCGEGQPLGIPLSSGGPYMGFMCTRMKNVRQLPGRIVGRTLDLDGKPGFTLTLQAREQHIRRSKATSNICTNQGLMVTAATIYMSLMGHQGLKNVAVASHQNLNQLSQLLTALPGVQLRFSGSSFHELVVQFDKPLEPILASLQKNKILAGYPLAEQFPSLSNCLLICTTETKSNADLTRLVDQLAASC